MREFTTAARKATPKIVEARLRTQEPKYDTKQKHWVQVQGRWWPVKQAAGIVTGVDILDFNTQEARVMFMHLGFKVERR